jgi:hypothetical protein
LVVVIIVSTLKFSVRFLGWAKITFHHHVNPHYKCIVQYIFCAEKMALDQGLASKEYE